jgi:iron complex outermembrane receptor protein
MVHRSFDFLNPKAGFSYQQHNTTYYASVSMAHKEPNRDDFEAGTTQQPTSEQLIDYELGVDQHNETFKWGVNLFYMDYKNQLVLTGKINDVGSYTRTNVPLSYRAGIELEMSWKINKELSSNANFTWSQNKIKSFTEYYDDYDNGGQVTIAHKNTDITLSPNVIASHTLTFTPNKTWEFAITSKYVSNQYLDNTQNETRKLGDYFNVKLQGHINNFTNVLYTPSGYTYSYRWNNEVTTSNNYYPMAGRNYWMSILIDWK